MAAEWQFILRKLIIRQLFVHEHQSGLPADSKLFSYVSFTEKFMFQVGKIFEYSDIKRGGNKMKLKIIAAGGLREYLPSL